MILNGSTLDEIFSLRRLRHAVDREARKALGNVLPPAVFSLL